MYQGSSRPSTSQKCASQLRVALLAFRLLWRCQHNNQVASLDTKAPKPSRSCQMLCHDKNKRTKWPKNFTRSISTVAPSPESLNREAQHRLEHFQSSATIFLSASSGKLMAEMGALASSSYGHHHCYFQGALADFPNFRNSQGCGVQVTTIGYIYLQGIHAAWRRDFAVAALL